MIESQKNYRKRFDKIENELRINTNKKRMSALISLSKEFVSEKKYIHSIMIQNVFDIDVQDALIVMSRLENMGVVSNEDGAGVRKVLIEQ
ncbi:hypothetical protein A3715_14035 [Oleiphilus sp. HI0009]|nr:hypothetical protein A3715_14035 [Oleiphilus sp. HI0009]